MLQAKSLGERCTAVAASTAARRHGLPASVPKDGQLPVIEVLWMNLLVTRDGHVGITAESGTRHICTYAVRAVDAVDGRSTKQPWLDTVLRAVTDNEVVVGPVDMVIDNSSV